MSDHDELGSGQIERHPDRPIIHFGSPSGSQYHDTDTRTADQHPATNIPMYRLTGGKR